MHQEAKRWHVVVELADSDCLALSTESKFFGQCVDVFHGTVGDRGQHLVLSRSFTELLELILTMPESFWLEGAFKGHGYR